MELPSDSSVKPQQKETSSLRQLIGTIEIDLTQVLDMLLCKAGE